MSQTMFLKPPSSRTPLSYTGGKAILYSKVEKLLPQGLHRVVSPFSGAAGLELKIAASGIPVHCHDVYPPNAHFYRYFNGESREVTEAARRIAPLSRDDFIRYGAGQGEAWHAVECPYEKAAIYWVASKQGFAGRIFTTTPSNTPFSSITLNYFHDPDWDDWENPHFTYKEQDWQDTLRDYPDDFLYLDPPYVEKPMFYGWFGGQDEFAHEALRDAVVEHSAPWIMSYAPHDKVYELYEGFEILEFTWTNMTGSVKKGSEKPKMRELLILKDVDSTPLTARMGSQA